MLIARNEEKEKLEFAYQKDGPQFVAVYGRRRIGKTHLIKEVFKDKFCFIHYGLSPRDDLSWENQMKLQLEAFYRTLLSFGYKVDDIPKDWFEAFDILGSCLNTPSNKRKIIFIDELAWMDTPSSNFLAAFERFYNQWVFYHEDKMLVVCASATSWILNEVIHNTGGLHNRVTLSINLKPFTLKECEEYAKYRQLIVDKDFIIRYYMALGGVAYYWDYLLPGKSVEQNLDLLFCHENSPLRNEYDYLLRSLFKSYSDYTKIIEILSEYKIGLSREEIIKHTNLPKNGYLTERLKNLESCGFIRQYNAYGKKEREALYQLVDNYLLFYFEFLRLSPTDENYFLHLANSPKKTNWEGRAFEQTCLNNISSIKQALGISGVHTEISSFRCKEDNERGIKGHQIDLVIERDDRIIHLCEMKYSSTPYVMTKKDYDSWLSRPSDFISITKTKCVVMMTMLSPHGLAVNKYSSLIQFVLKEDALFQ